MAVDPLVATPTAVPEPTAAVETIPGGGGVPLETPRNGLAGLKYWRNDMVSGLLVSLVSLPLSLGIAVASGAPPICGLTSAIIAGLIFPFLGGAYMTIGGPAAGLAPAILATMTALGRGDLAAGYPLLLVVICLTGAAQVVLSLLKAARFAAVFPAAMVEGMLAAIGLMIIAKQLPSFLGRPFASHEFFGIIREAPEAALGLNPKVALTASLCLALIFGLSALKSRWFRVIPPQLVAVLFGVALGRLLRLDRGELIAIPSGLAHGIVVPHFLGLLHDPGLWIAALIGVVTLTMVDGVESLATASAIDRIDPFHRKSRPNRVLLAMGCANMASSLFGGLTVIPGGIKSNANIEGGGRTLWANFYNAIYLLIFVLVASPLINRIPLAALSAVLIHIGFKLCRPKVWRKVASIGREQLAVFTITVVVTLASDLLIGIAAGMLAKLALSYGLTSVAVVPARRRRGPIGRFAALFRSPVAHRELEGGVYHVSFGGPLVSFNSLAVNAAIEAVPPEAKAVVLHVDDDDVTLIDHTSCENLLHFAAELQRDGRGVTIEGLDLMKARSSEKSSMRLAAAGLDPAHPILRAGRRIAGAATRLAAMRPAPRPPDTPAEQRATLDFLSLTRSDEIPKAPPERNWLDRS